jgi:hypothetical protein
MTIHATSATRSSLLSRVRDLQDADGWMRFDQLYRPMLIEYARHRGLRQEAAEEIAQQCLAAIVAVMRPHFQRFLTIACTAAGAGTCRD